MDYSQQPKRESSLDALWPPFRNRVDVLFKRMEERGYDPVAFETRRSWKRQRWLYGYGRKHHKDKKPITWTMKSRHIVGKAVDVVSKEYWWSSKKFYRVLHEEARKLGLYWLRMETCHIEWRGQKK